jgi:hypothetical protein
MSSIVIRGGLIAENGAGIVIEGFGHKLDMDGVSIVKNRGAGLELRVPAHLKAAIWYPTTVSDAQNYAVLNQVFECTDPESCKPIIEKSHFWPWAKDKGLDLAQLAVSIWQAVKGGG